MIPYMAFAAVSLAYQGLYLIKCLQSKSKCKPIVGVSAGFIITAFAGVLFAAAFW